MNMDFIFISRKDKSIRDMQTEFRTETAAKILIQELQVFATCCRPDVNTKLAKKKNQQDVKDFFLPVHVSKTDSLRGSL